MASFGRKALHVIGLLSLAYATFVFNFVLWWLPPPALANAWILFWPFIIGINLALGGFFIGLTIAYFLWLKRHWNG